MVKLFYFLPSFQASSEANCSFVFPAISIPSFLQASRSGSDTCDSRADEAVTTGVACGTTGCGLGARGTASGVSGVPEAVIISLDMPFHPLSNSFRACPNDLANWGILLLPKRNMTTAMMSTQTTGSSNAIQCFSLEAVVVGPVY